MQRKIPRRALIFGARLAPDPEFVSKVLAYPQLRLPWIERKRLTVLTKNEFFDMWTAALEINLYAEFDNTIPEDEKDALTNEYLEKTGGNWWAIDTLLEVFHEELGIYRGGTYRTITRAMIERIRSRLSMVQWEGPAEKEPERKGGKRGLDD